MTDRERATQESTIYRSSVRSILAQREYSFRWSAAGRLCHCAPLQDGQIAAVVLDHRPIAPSRAKVGQGRVSPAAGSIVCAHRKPKQTIALTFTAFTSPVGCSGARFNSSQLGSPLLRGLLCAIVWAQVNTGRAQAIQRPCRQCTESIHLCVVQSKLFDNLMLTKQT